MSLTLLRKAPDLVAELRAAGFRAIAAERGDLSYVAVIIPYPGGAHGYGQYEVEPHGDVLRVRWHRKDTASPVAVADVDTAARAAGLILDHIAGLYP